MSEEEKALAVPRYVCERTFHKQVSSVTQRMTIKVHYAKAPGSVGVNYTTVLFRSRNEVTILISTGRGLNTKSENQNPESDRSKYY